MEIPLFSRSKLCAIREAAQRTNSFLLSLSGSLPFGKMTWKLLIVCYALTALCGGIPQLVFPDEDGNAEEEESERCLPLKECPPLMSILEENHLGISEFETCGFQGLVNVQGVSVKVSNENSGSKYYFKQFLLISRVLVPMFESIIKMK